MATPATVQRSPVSSIDFVGLDPEVWFLSLSFQRGTKGFFQESILRVYSMKGRNHVRHGSDDISTLRYFDLPIHANDREMADKLLGGIGNITKHTATVRQVQRLLLQQWNGEEGVLFTDGRVTFVYIADEEGHVSKLGISRSSDPNIGWCLSPNHFGQGVMWSAGSRFLYNM